ncbi:MAG: UvrD-helicase domain-containing protein [Elusimicrobia bacterium]|nr:UvrD-helicase domain-containing protein [Elusimicrobiota bacterium]
MDTPWMEHLNPPQREAVLATEGPLLILAGAGTGKTRVITHRIAHLLARGISPWQILAVTFTNKAADEMRHRVEHLVPGQGRAVCLSTYHAWCAQLLRVEAAAAGLPPHFVIYDEGDQKALVKECLQELNLDEKSYKPGVLVAMISRAKDDLIDARSYEIHALTSTDPVRQIVTSVYRLYQKKLERAGGVDFGDLIMKAVELLRDQAAIRTKYQERFRYLMVDEYQDTNHAQYLLTKYLAAQHKNICVVGDDDQAVYVWRGADIRNILEFERDYPNAKVITLEQNYRSPRTILDAAWGVVQRNQHRKEKKLWNERAGGETVRVEELPNEVSEAQFVVGEVHALAQSQYALSDFAVFYRTNAQSRVLEDAFRRAELPYRLVGTVRFYERAEVKDVLAYLRVILNPRDSLSLKRILNVPPRGIGKATLQLLEQAAKARQDPLFEILQRLDQIAGLGPKAKAALERFLDLLHGLIVDRKQETAKGMIQQVLERTGMIQALEEEGDAESLVRLDNLQELVNAVEEYEQRSPDRSLEGFLEQASLLTEADTVGRAPNGVTLMTVHLAKGLEFPVVFLTGLEEGLFPIGDSTFALEELEEERRLCYVGMTRAKDRLYLTSTASRRLYGQPHWNVPSRFIAEAGLVTRPESPLPAEPQAGVTPWTFPFSTPPPTPIQIGQRVRHPEFGEGKIIEKSGTGEHLKVVVLFDTGRWKKLLVKYARLEPLGT